MALQGAHGGAERLIRARAWGRWGCEPKLVQAACEGEDGAREQLVDAFMPMISSVARRYAAAARAERGELIQDGVVGLLRASRRYDADVGPFWPYASWWVRQAMQQHVAEMNRPIVLSDRALRCLARIKEARRASLRAGEGEPGANQLAETTGLSRLQVDKLLAAERVPCQLDEPVGVDDPAASTIGEQLADPVADEDYDRVDTRLQAQALRKLARRLEPRERGVVFAHYGLAGSPRTLREIAGDLALSVERVRQIEEVALGKLRAAAG
jgi:RNA polymerase sigma factor (sigma-70 family)